jgi:hypothetical protein
MPRISQHTASIHDSAIQQLREFRRQYPNASSLQKLKSGILPHYPEDPEAYRLCREWEEAHDQYNRSRQEAALAEIFEDDGSDPTPTDALTLLTLPIALRMHGRWQQTSACHKYEDTPPDRQLQRSFHHARDALLEKLTPRDQAILALYAEGHGPRDIRQLLALTLTEQRVGQIIQQICSKAAYTRRTQGLANHHRRSQ